MAEILRAKKSSKKCTGSISEVMSRSLGLLESFNKPTEFFSTYLGNLDPFNNPVEYITFSN